MKNRFSFGITAIIFVISIFSYFGLLVLITDIFDLPDWVWTIGNLLFLVLIFEIPSRLGPKPFDTTLSRYLKLPVRDRIIFLFSFIAIAALVVIADERVKQLPILQRLAYAVIVFLVAFGPIMLLGTPETRKSLFKRNEDAKPNS